MTNGILHAQLLTILLFGHTVAPLPTDILPLRDRVN